MAAAALAAILFLAPAALAAPGVSAQKAVLLDADSGRILFEKDAASRSLIASTTKIMTALLVCERCNLADRVKIPRAAVGIEGSSMYLREDEILTVQDLLYGLMLHSGNDAAVALAIYCSGTEADFVTEMNEKAEALGLRETHYANPNGLDHDGNYSTALDLARLSAYALQNADFYRTVSCRSVTAGGRSLRNHNKLLFRYDGAIGVKTGYTKAAGRILVSAAERDGRRLIAVTINAPDDWNDHTALLDYGFSAYRTVQLAKRGEIVAAVPVVSGEAAQVAVAVGGDARFPLAAEEQWQLVPHLPPFVYAPVSAGAAAGTADLCVDGCMVGSVPLYYAASVACGAEKRWARILGG